MEQFCVLCNWWRNQADDNCKKNHFKEKKRSSNESKRTN